METATDATASPPSSTAQQSTSSSLQSGAKLEDKLENLCRGYAKYLEYPTIHTQQTGIAKETIEQMLVQLDELTALVDGIRTNTVATQNQIPALLTQTSQLKRTFALIDAMEEFVRVININIDQIEERVSAAEQQDSISTKAKKVFSSLQNLSYVKKISILPGSSANTESSSSQTTGEENENIESAPEPVQIIDTKQYIAKMKLELSQ